MSDCKGSLTLKDAGCTSVEGTNNFLDLFSCLGYLHRNHEKVLAAAVLTGRALEAVILGWTVLVNATVEQIPEAWHFINVAMWNKSQ